MPEVTYIGLGPILAKGQEAVEKATIESGEHLVGAQQAAAPVNTGTLRGSIHIDSIESGGGSCTVTTSTGGESDQYAIFVHEGTGEHVVSPKGKALFWPGAEHPLNRPVTIPARAANPFMSDPLLANVGLYERNLAAAAAGVF